MAGKYSITEHWLQPFFFLGENPISMVGAGLTSASAMTLVGFWVMYLLGQGVTNPYAGIILFLILPALFIIGLLIIPIGIYQRWRMMKATGMLPATYPKIDLGNPVLRHWVEFIILTTAVNFMIIVVASYRGVAYMDTPQFCGLSCHQVMVPEYTAYQIGPHNHVECVACHIGSGADAFVKAKVDGTLQLIDFVLGTYPRPIHAPVAGLRPARVICEQCHNPAMFLGEKLIIKTSFGDDEDNPMTKTILVMHLGGRDALSKYTGIHGVHLGHIEYIATDADRQNIPWVSRRNPDGTTTVYVSSGITGPVKGEKRLMDCIDCHNRVTHGFQTAEDALDHAMTVGIISTSLPYVHKQGLQLLNGDYSSHAEATAQIKSKLEDYYKANYPKVYAAQLPLIDQAASGLATIYKQNVFPDMKVTWGTHPDNLGHNSYPGCFRCHDGNHTSQDGKEVIPQDCSTCHNLLTPNEVSTKLMTDLGSLQ